jgi:biopolymer transport protein ExbD
VVQIDIDEHSVVHWQGEPITDPAQLDERLRAVAALAVPPELHLRPHRAARYEVVANVLASTKRHGLTKIGIVGSEQFAK